MPPRSLSPRNMGRAFATAPRGLEPPSSGQPRCHSVSNLRQVASSMNPSSVIETRQPRPRCCICPPLHPSILPSLHRHSSLLPVATVALSGAATQEPRAMETGARCRSIFLIRLHILRSGCLCPPSILFSVGWSTHGAVLLASALPLASPPIDKSLQSDFKLEVIFADCSLLTRRGLANVALRIRSSGLSRALIMASLATGPSRADTNKAGAW